MKVFTYWECSRCRGIVRGDSKTCPACGNAIENDTKYLMPDNPIVMEAVKNNAILINNNACETEQYTDENGVSSDIVPDELVSDKPNWECGYCGCQNKAESSVCTGCGAGKEESDSDYFGNKPEMTINDISDYNRRTGTEYHEHIENTSSTYNNDDNSLDVEVKHNKVLDAIAEFMTNRGKTVAIVLAALVATVFLVWMFTPVTRQATVEGFAWERSIDVEEYKLYHESDWDVPSGAKVTSQHEEIHHYAQVFDHNETKQRTVSEEVQDGYETTYVDLGNGQAEVVQTPKYKTVYHTEEYEEPVYKSVPVYRTKYYYDIGRWETTTELTTCGYDKEPYWYNTDLPTYVSNPSYGDKKQGDREETYSAIITDENGNEHNVNYKYSEWIELRLEDEITYKTFRFSQTPLNLFT